MQEIVRITILQLKSAKSNDFKKHVRKFWEKLVIYEKVAAIQLFGEEFVKATTELLKDDTKLLDASYYEFTVTKWPSYNIDLAICSNQFKDIIFEVNVEHPKTNVKFKYFFAKGMWQMCETLDEKFDEKLLL